MKANELMIGDWVRLTLTPNPTTVTAINGNSIGTKAVHPLRYDEIEPIPMSPEILEQNGFEKKGHRYGIYEDYFDFEMYEYNDGTWLVSYHCCELSLPDEQVLLFHVHQLQHFMRHCGIEKEIIVKEVTP